MQNKSTNAICLIVQDGSNRSQCVLWKLSIKIEVIWGDGLKIWKYGERGPLKLTSKTVKFINPHWQTWKNRPKPFSKFQFYRSWARPIFGKLIQYFFEISIFESWVTSMLVTDVGDQMCWWQYLAVGDKSRYMYVLSHMFMIKFYGKIFYLPYLVLNSLFWMSVWEIGHCYGDIKLCPNILKSAMRWVIIMGICQWGINRSTRLFPELHFNGSAAVAEFLLINRLIEFHFNNHWR